MTTPADAPRPAAGALPPWMAALPPGLLATLGIELVVCEPSRIVARMPVGPRVHQPFGLLHGGASVALAESVVSIGGVLNVDHTRFTTVGLEINANHVRAVRDGVVTAEGTPLHLGRSTQVWEVRIRDERERLVCVSRCTLAVVPIAGPGGAEAGA